MEAVVKETVAEMEEIHQEMQQLTDERNAEKEAMESAKADDEGAIELLKQAIASLKSFYGNNAETGTDMGEVQGSVKLLQKKSADPEKPEFAPSHAGSRKGESKGIESMERLRGRKANLDDSIATANQSADDAHNDEAN